MRQQLLDELMQISEEESKYKAGQAAIEEQLYSEASIQEIDRQKLLRRGKLITVRRHSRFVEFPLQLFHIHSALLPEHPPGLGLAYLPAIHHLQ